MPLDVKSGDHVPIPCRHCGKALITFEVREGEHSLECPRCNLVTKVRAKKEKGSIRIRTSAASPN